MDEAGIDVADIQDCQKVTGPSYVIRSYITSPTKRPRVSVIECICADGTCIDPLVIYRGNKEMERYTPQDIENTPKWEYYIDSSAWTNGIIAQAWLENVFIPQTKPDDINQWQLLIMDNSLSHCTTNFKKKVLSNKIYPLYLPPHSTHVTQPLEVTCFRPLKRDCEEADFSYNVITGIELNKDAFAIFYKKYRAVIFPRFNISGGFKRSGIWPLNPSMVCNMTFATKPKKKKAEELQDNSKDQTSVPPEQVDKFENPLQYLDELLQNEKIDLPIYSEMRMIISRHEQKWKNKIENLKMESLKLQKIIDDLTDDPQEETTKA